MPATEIILPDSGATIRVKRISPMTLVAIENAHPAPEPPLEEVDYGSGKTKLEPNPLDPAYIRQLAAHGRDKQMLLIKAFVKLGVDCEIDAALLADYRAEMAGLGVTLDSDDKYVYVANILCESQADIEALTEAIQATSGPTEKGVAAKVATFPGEVQGGGPVPVEGAA